MIETAVGETTLTTTIEGRQRFPVRVRYAPQYRSSPEALASVPVPAPNGMQIPLGQVVEMLHNPEQVPALEPESRRGRVPSLQVTGLVNPRARRESVREDLIGDRVRDPLRRIGVRAHGRILRPATAARYSA